MRIFLAAVIIISFAGSALAQEKIESHARCYHGIVYAGYCEVE